MSEPSPIPSDSRQSPESSSTPATGPPPTQQGRPRREGNDSLWKRARRTLGTNSLTFLQPQSRPPPAPKSEDGSGTGPAAPSKRREQVRHAQRTHRQRTQNYIKTLESEVVRLRGSESHLMQERDKFQGQVEILRTTLIFSNIPLPPGIDPPPTVPSQPLSSNDPEMATVSYRADDLNHQRLHMNWMAPTAQNYPQMNQTLPQRPLHAGHSQGYHDPAIGQNPTNLPDDLSLQQLSFASSPYDNQFVGPDPGHLAKADSPEVAIEFVLALEHPCMTHLPHPTATPSDDPSNHVLMASTPLIFSAPQPPQPNNSWNWTANSSIIKELLNLSSSINLEGEITPVEAWHRLRQHPDFWKLDRQDIDNIKNELSSAVECYGFGAILDERLFQETVNKYLPVGQNTYPIRPL